MCLIVFAWRCHKEYPLLLLANRDEFHNRPTKGLHWWDSGIAAGKDLVEGGTWMGINRSGKWAAVTNYRDPGNLKQDAVSRGHLVTDYLLSDTNSHEFLNKLHSSPDVYNGYSLLAGDKNHLYYYSNAEKNITALGPGIYGLSNHLLDTPWPKVVNTKAQFTKWLENIDPEAAFALMGDKTLADDNELPDTGVGIELERILSAACIESPVYGTRSTSILTISHDRTSISELDRLTGKRIDIHTEFDIPV